ncbi:hypothetical protein COF09_30485 [Bacillus toyonensis]|uniref:hypothetical protein n=1 Tax=Bacillus toyonensis TaxID=155322 RepID=UPI000BFD8058|nr:hypothetical protein [Bacillus toyonensis]PHC35985.1 hypothetical protein COF09_30485 [Bacillus toyonensis]
MKYKNRKHTKRKYKQALLATVATMSLGVSTLGSTAPVFAASQDYSAWWGLDEFKHRCLEIDGATISKVTNVREDTQNAIEIKKFSIPNIEGETKEVSTPVHQKTTQKSMRISSTKEFSMGQELEVSTGPVEGLIADFKAKLTFGQKFSKASEEFTSEEDKITYGGDKFKIKPGQRVDVEYIFKRPAYIADLETVNPIHYNVSQKWALRYVTNAQVHTMSDARSTYSVPGSYIPSTKYQNDYEFFKDILMNGSADAAEINYHGEGKNDVYIMSQQTIKDTFMLDEQKHQVQMKQSHANLELKGASTDVAVHYKIIDIKTGKIVAEDTTPSQPINGKIDRSISFSPTHPMN